MTTTPSETPDLSSTDTSNVLLQGIVGSTAYGLAGPDSDIDRIGMFATPTVQFHGLHLPDYVSVVKTNPDITLHEAGKFARLALNGNPSVMELLWLEEYEVKTALGQQAIDIRTAFLSAPRVRDAYLGYAVKQFLGFDSANTHKKAAKYARHLLRLCWQGFELYRNGWLEMQLPFPEHVHEFGERVASGDTLVAQNMLTEYEERFEDTKSVLPDRPDEDAVEQWLRAVRMEYLEH